MSPVFSLDEELVFPHPVLHEPDGLLAVGGSLSVERLLLAYRWGIFPWYHEGLPILWWWTVPRLMVHVDEVHVSRSMKKLIRQQRYRVTFDMHFREVIEGCATVDRREQDGTWIIPDMIDAYSELHRQGYAHSIEVYANDEIVGGIYGIALGKIFFGESMFSVKPNASKFGFIQLCSFLKTRGFEWVDCQQDTPHMRSLGGKMISEKSFLQILRENQLHILRGNAS